MNVNKNLVDYLYSQIANVELENAVTSISIVDLKRAAKDKKSLNAVLKEIETTNESINRENLCKLAASFRTAFESAPFMSIEKYLFLRVLSKVRRATNQFSITYQVDMTEDTIGNSESGLTPFKPTRVTAFGLLNCFNSYDILRDEVNRQARKQEQDRIFEASRLKLAKALNLNPELVTKDMLQSAGFMRACKG